MDREQQALERVLSAIAVIRCPAVCEESKLHEMVMQALEDKGLAAQHEVRLAPCCRIDVMCGGVGIEIKRGKVEKARILQQLRKYADCEQVQGLILVTEKTVPLPHTIYGKPVRLVCLNRLWGIAL